MQWRVLCKRCALIKLYLDALSHSADKNQVRNIYSTTMPYAKYTLGRCRVEDILVVDGSNHVWKGLYTLVMYRCLLQCLCTCLHLSE